MQVKGLRRALRNLDQEAAHIAQDNRRAAAELIAQANQVTQLLVLHTGLGRPGRVPGTREMVLPDFPYIIPYRVKDQCVEVLRVFHASRKWPTGITD